MVEGVASVAESTVSKVSNDEPPKLSIVTFIGTFFSAIYLYIYISVGVINPNLFPFLAFTLGMSPRHGGGA